MQNNKNKKIVLSSSVKKDNTLLRLAREATKNQTVQRELNHLILELSKGNFEAGLGPGHIKKTDVYYSRGDHGARLFYRKIGEDENNIYIDIVGYSAKGRNEDKVINKLIEIYEKY